jgi:hypothetical protein
MHPEYVKDIKNGKGYLSKQTSPISAFRLKNILHAGHATTPKCLYEAGVPQILHSDGFIVAQLPTAIVECGDGVAYTCSSSIEIFSN